MHPVSHTTVEHCDIFDLTYSGVSIGSTWGYAESPAHHNRIRFNHIHDIGHGVLSDMGAVYTLGVSPGTVVEGNVIHGIASHDYGGWGLYTDEGLTGVVMRNNLVHGTSSGGFHQHYGRDNTIENNIFAVARDWQLQRTQVEDHTSFCFARNIVWWNSDTPLVKGDWNKGIVTEANCYWNASGRVVFPDGKDLAARQASGQDERSIVADPKFTDPLHGNFAIDPDSPALPLGFEPIDPSLAGRRTAEIRQAEHLTEPCATRRSHEPNTLCGSKAMWREDYLRLDANRAFFGDFDPFGEFDLLFGADKLRLKIMDMPVRYKQRTYGETSIQR